MKSRLWLNMFLLLLAAVLGAWFYFKPKIETQNQFRFSSLQAAGVKKILIAKTADAPVTIEKRDQHWFITTPFKARADSTLVSHLLELVAFTATRRVPAADLGRFDLEQPWAKLTFDDQEISFGDQYPPTKEQYVATGGYIYLIPQQYTSILSLPGNYFLSHQPLTENETPVGFELPGLTLTQKDGKWESAPANGQLTQDQLNRFTDEWKHAYSLNSQPLSGRTGAPVKIRLASGSTLNFQILEKDPDVLLLREDEMIAYRFPAQIGVRLIDPLATAKKQK
ncbi:MAG: DUF4340 domain-containing protein [Burkholderiales bacterium]